MGFNPKTYNCPGFVGENEVVSWPEPDLASFEPSSWLLDFTSRTIGNGPFWAKSWPGAFWSEIFVFDFEAMTGLKHTKKRDAALSGTKKGCISSNE